MLGLFGENMFRFLGLHCIVLRRFALQTLHSKPERPDNPKSRTPSTLKWSIGFGLVHRCHSLSLLKLVLSTWRKALGLSGPHWRNIHCRTVSESWA